MANWYEVAVKVMRSQDSGEIKEVVERYMVESDTLGDANRRVLDEMEAYGVTEMDVTQTSERKVAGVIDNDGQKWYKAKVVAVMVDEKSGKEKDKSLCYMVSANLLSDAVASLMSHMRGCVYDWYMYGISETSIVDVMRYSSNCDGEEK